MMEFGNDLDISNSHNFQPHQLMSFAQDSFSQANNHLILSLQNIWSNEKFCKELLKYEEEFIENLKDLVEKTEKEIERLNNSNNQYLKEDAEILELDLERTKFLLKDYFRIRLGKIDKYLIHIVKEDLTHLLSKTEFEFAFESFKMKRNLFNEELYKNIAPELKDFQPYPENQEMIVAPDSKTYVIVQSETREQIHINVRDIWQDSNETATITNKEIYCLPYVLIR
jgi:GINS complex subunit 4